MNIFGVRQNFLECGKIQEGFPGPSVEIWTALQRDMETALSAPDEIVTVAEKRYALSLIVRAIRAEEG